MQVITGESSCNTCSLLIHRHSNGKGWWEWSGVGVQDFSQPVPAVEQMPQEGPDFLVLLCKVTPAGACSDCSAVLGILQRALFCLTMSVIEKPSTNGYSSSLTLSCFASLLHHLFFFCLNFTSSLGKKTKPPQL